MDIIEQVRQNIKDTLRYITDRTTGGAQVGIILGSGLGGVVDAVQGQRVFPYSDLPHFPKSTTEGHAGNLVLGTLSGKRVALMQGRFHYYEGYTSAGIAFPIRVLRALGIKVLIVTCAAGALNSDYKTGDIMAITDHVNLMGNNPLAGSNDNEIGPRFLDMTEAYDKSLLNVAESASRERGIDLKKGVYAGVLGPSYETPAEVRFLSTIADAVGMSTVPEVTVARHSGISVLGLAVITNTQNHDRGISHQEVLDAARRSSDMLSGMIIDVLERISIQT
jgi:purine-nucleoside phosphorylase